MQKEKKKRNNYIKKTYNLQGEGAQITAGYVK